MRVHPRIAGEANFSFIAAVYRNGQLAARSNPMRVSWTKQGQPKVQVRPRLEPTITLSVNGVSYRAKFGDNSTTKQPGGRASRRYATLIDRCLRESPAGARVQIAPNGSAPAPTVTASFTGFPEPQWSVRINWGGTFFPCPGNPCTANLPAHAPLTHGVETLARCSMTGKAKKE